MDWDTGLVFRWRSGRTIVSGGTSFEEVLGLAPKRVGDAFSSVREQMSRAAGTRNSGRDGIRGHENRAPGTADATRLLHLPTTQVKRELAARQASRPEAGMRADEISRGGRPRSTAIRTHARKGNIRRRD